MLEDKVIQRIRESVDAELRPRDRSVHMEAHAFQGRHALSGRAFVGRGEIGCKELTERADLIWRIIQRCYTAYQVSAPDESTIDGLNQQFKFWIDSESNLLRSMLDVARDPVQSKAAMLQMIIARGNDLVRRYQNEAKFYVHALMNPPKKPEQSNAVTVQNNYGQMAIAAGSDAQAGVGATENAQLVQALEQLRAALQQATALPADQRGDSLGVIDEAIIAAREPKTNKLKLLGLLQGVGAAVSLMANAPDAWKSVRATAKLIGIDIP
jgi:hypothetical protein